MAAEGTQFLVKWRGLGYASATWETAESLASPADTAAVARYYAISEPHRRAPAEAKLPAEGTLQPPPVFRPGCNLRDYQCVSFDWMVRNMRRRRNVILGDEMVRLRSPEGGACCAPRSRRISTLTPD